MGSAPLAFINNWSILTRSHDARNDNLSKSACTDLIKPLNNQNNNNSSTSSLLTNKFFLLILKISLTISGFANYQSESRKLLEDVVFQHQFPFLMINSSSKDKNRMQMTFCQNYDTTQPPFTH